MSDFDDHFLVLARPDVQEIARYSKASLRDVGGIRDALNFVRDHAFVGTVQAIFYAISPEDLKNPFLLDHLGYLSKEVAELQLLLALIPPPPSIHETYREVIRFLMGCPAGFIVHPNDVGRSYCEIGWNGGRICNREVMPNGTWGAAGLHRARNYLVEVLGLAYLKMETSLLPSESKKSSIVPFSQAQNVTKEFGPGPSAPKIRSKVVVPVARPLMGISVHPPVGFMRGAAGSTLAASTSAPSFGSRRSRSPHRRVYGGRGRRSRSPRSRSPLRRSRYEKHRH